MHLVKLVAACSILATAAAAQAGGFVPGQIWIHSKAITGQAPQGAALVRVDPDLQGGALVLDYAPVELLDNTMVYEPFRNRLFLRTTLAGVLGQYEVDAQGNATFVSMDIPQPSMFAATGDGRVYMVLQGGNDHWFAWVDAHGVRHDVLELDGSEPFQVGPGFSSTKALHYDETTNGLLIAETGGDPTCGGAGGFYGVTLRRIQLTPDGSRAWGPVNCNWVPVSADGGFFVHDDPSQFSPLPGGDVLLSVTTAENGAASRLVRVDPSGLSWSFWSVTGPYSACAAATSCYSPVLDRAVLLDNYNSQLRLFAEGEDGAGTIVVPSVAITAPGNDFPKEATTLAIPFDACEGGFGVFGLGHSGTGVAGPFLKGIGCPSPGAAVALRVSGAPASSQGLLFVGSTEAALPFKGGTLYVDPILLSLPLTTSPTGAATLAVHVPADPTLSGVRLILQASIASAQAAQGVALSQGLEMRIP